jgi:ATP-dependent helicase YprA (DUF1998 family)
MNEMSLHSVAQKLHHSLVKYIEATYHIADSSLTKQRREALDTPGVIHQIPYIESTPRYPLGQPFSKIAGLPPAAVQALLTLVEKNERGKRVLYDPPYQHQADAIEHGLVGRKNLVVMTGTGSGKTESFLMPILGKLAIEAQERPNSFAKPAVRAIVLYPMNALVNDQLSRLRAIFGDKRIAELFTTWAGRPPRFARYTSRSPYAGRREKAKDQRNLKQIGDFYVGALDAATNGDDKEKAEAAGLVDALKSRGKWPAKPDLAAWYGKGHWQDKNENFRRAVTLPQDSELITRHEVQLAPPDVLVTNYSMLEYMLMRPVERNIFDLTAAWLHESPESKFTLVLDEAHMYRGAGGTEVALLLRRLRDRLDVPEDKFQVVCATASFQDKDYAPVFASQLTGLAPASFQVVRSDFDYRPGARQGTNAEATLLAAIDLEALHSEDPEQQIASVREFLRSRDGDLTLPFAVALYRALVDFPPLSLLVNQTMRKAQPAQSLPEMIFPEAATLTAAKAVAALASIASLAKPGPDEASLLPARVHSFFRGLQGLWVCLDPRCSGLGELHGLVAGRLYTQPRDRCDSCNGIVLELFTCRQCGSAYARGYSPTPADPKWVWNEPGARLAFDSATISPLEPLDLLLEKPREPERVSESTLDLLTGELDAEHQTPRVRKVYLPIQDSGKDDEDEDDAGRRGAGIFSRCGACGRGSANSPVQDHETKGDQPLQVLVTRQIALQPPGPQPATPLAPLRGRKVLVFSDSRQVAARLAPSLQLFSSRDAIRSAIAVGWSILETVPGARHNLNDVYCASLVGAHVLGLRLRPELDGAESFSIYERVRQLVQNGGLDTPEGISLIVREVGRSTVPRAILADIFQAIRNPLLGFEALALGSVVESLDVADRLGSLKDLPGATSNSEERIQIVRAWLREWRRQGFYLRDTPPEWMQQSAGRDLSIRTRGSSFRNFVARLPTEQAKRVFKKDWLPVLLQCFTDNVRGEHRLRGSELSLLFGGAWRICRTCKTPQREAAAIVGCLECGGPDVDSFNPEEDPYFISRKGFYRDPVVRVMKDRTKAPLSIIAAEHTAQLNAAQHEDVFSKGERNELLFQDVVLPAGDEPSPRPAVDVLSSTTTMEVGIDIGQLSGVALRNMPPARANYQQRSGRAGRRGNAVASVIAYSGSDTHDEHFFSNPQEMITGDVVDPRLSLDNVHISQRHIRAFLLQAYLQDRVVTPGQGTTQLFSVLGTLGDFLKPSTQLNRFDLESYLRSNLASLKVRAGRILPDKIAGAEREEILESMVDELLKILDEALADIPRAQEAQTTVGEADDELIEVQAETGDVSATGQGDPKTNLLDRLLYKGIIPRYAFPTDVATFHVFKRGTKSAYRPSFEYLPAQGMLAALSQYAPGRQVWIDGRLYSSRAIYSQMRDERRGRWETRRLHAECFRCGHSLLEDANQGSNPGDKKECPACLGEATLGPAKWWLRPPGFAHPIDLEPTVTPEDIPEVSYATRAKLTLESAKIEDWMTPNDFIRVYPARTYLRVTNSGPAQEGYTYCVACGRIESTRDPQSNLSAPHSKPYPDQREPRCTAKAISTVVLGTDFISDVALFSFTLSTGVRLSPVSSLTEVAMRTLAEAISRAATDALQIEHGEVVAEYRPAVTEAGVTGEEAELFLYDTLPGGAGFSRAAAEKPLELLRNARSIMAGCPDPLCSSSCYRCLRTFRNRLDHPVLDRHVGTALVDLLLEGQLPEFDQARIRSARDLLIADLARNPDSKWHFAANPSSQDQINVKRDDVTRTIVVGNPLRLPEGHDHDGDTLILSELMVRKHLANASAVVQAWL